VPTPELRLTTSVAVGKTIAVGAGSVTLTAVDENWTIGSLSKIVTTVVAGVPALAPIVESRLTGLVREKIAVSGASGTLSSVDWRSKVWDVDPGGNVKRPVPPTA
jgi:hypothetical protein